MEKYRTRNVNNEKKDAQQKETRETGLWTVQEAANYFNVSERTIRREIRVGKLPHLRIGGCIRLPRRTISDWVEAETRYNLGCVEPVHSSKGESTCDSINVTAFITLPANQRVENRLDALLKPEANK